MLLVISSVAISYLLLYPCNKNIFFVLGKLKRDIFIEWIILFLDVEDYYWAILHLVFLIFSLLFFLLSWLIDPGYLKKKPDQNFLVKRVFQNFLLFSFLKSNFILETPWGKWKQHNLSRVWNNKTTKIKALRDLSSMCESLWSSLPLDK